MFGISVLKAYKHFSELSPIFKAPTVLSFFYIPPHPPFLLFPPPAPQYGKPRRQKCPKWYILLSLMNARLRIQLCLRNPVAFNKFSYYNLTWVSIFFQCIKPWQLSDCSPRAEKQSMPVCSPLNSSGEQAGGRKQIKDVITILGHHIKCRDTVFQFKMDIPIVSLLLWF